MNDEIDWLICGLADDGDTVLIPGTIESNCQLCERAIFIAPSGQQLIAEKPETVVCCSKCGMIQIAHEEELNRDVTHSIAPGAAKEIVDYLASKKR